LSKGPKDITYKTLCFVWSCRGEKVPCDHLDSRRLFLWVLGICRCLRFVVSVACSIWPRKFSFLLKLVSVCYLHMVADGHAPNDTSSTQDKNMQKSHRSSNKTICNIQDRELWWNPKAPTLELEARSCARKVEGKRMVSIESSELSETVKIRFQNYQNSRST